MRAESDAWRMVDGGTPRRTVSGAQICCVRACTARGGGAYHNMYNMLHDHSVSFNYFALRAPQGVCDREWGGSGRAAWTLVSDCQ